MPCKLNCKLATMPRVLLLYPCTHAAWQILVGWKLKFEMKSRKKIPWIQLWWCLNLYSLQFLLLTTFDPKKTRNVFQFAYFLHSVTTQWTHTLRWNAFYGVLTLFTKIFDVWHVMLLGMQQKPNIVSIYGKHHLLLVHSSHNFYVVEIQLKSNKLNVTFLK